MELGAEIFGLQVFLTPLYKKLSSLNFEIKHLKFYITEEPMIFALP